jgi:membrane protease YdiL (CAAX protease family)
VSLPGTPSLAFLTVIFLLLPWMALRSGRRLRAAFDGAEGTSTPTANQVWVSSFLLQALLLYLAWRVGGEFEYRIFAVPDLSGTALLQAAAALLACLGIRALARLGLTAADRRTMMVYRLSPRTGRERMLQLATIVAASVAEEAAYRGVAFAILWYALGSGWAAAVLSAVAFALAHTVQGWRSAGWVFLVGLVMQGLAVLTGTLVLAMVVHFLYDVIATTLIRAEVEHA